MEKRRDTDMSREIAKKILRAGTDVLVTVISVTVEIMKELLKKKPTQE